ncbi:hypothetical protein L873DRAFT_1514975 [Choiromyces venosus 120613-1]|uniref:Secreted protein n=1 Tax=Choiromyces venosus 120613-1 TaxID=1336337 RepID=A0A3N4J8I2_9PEZI|nr:hypothetical protein L873DRAFT_1514975 [Choiromyces venosus 120613-1]
MHFSMFRKLHLLASVYCTVLYSTLHDGITIRYTYPRNPISYNTSKSSICELCCISHREYGNLIKIKKNCASIRQTIVLLGSVCAFCD